MHSFTRALVLLAELVSQLFALIAPVKTEAHPISLEEKAVDFIIENTINK